MITTGGNVNDVTQAVALLDGVPPVAGRRGRPRQRFDVLLADKGYDSHAVRQECRRRRTIPIISQRGRRGVKGLGKLRYVVEQTFALLHQFRRLAMRWERHLVIHDGFVSLACTLISWRRLINWTDLRSCQGLLLRMPNYDNPPPDIPSTHSAAPIA